MSPIEIFCIAWAAGILGAAFFEGAWTATLWWMSRPHGKTERRIASLRKMPRDWRPDRRRAS